MSKVTSLLSMNIYNNCTISELHVQCSVTQPSNIASIEGSKIAHAHKDNVGFLQIWLRSCQPSVFFRKIAPLSALWKSMRIVRMFKNCQVTVKKYTVLHVHCTSSTCTHMRSTWTSKVHVLCRKFNGTQKRCKIRKNICQDTQNANWRLAALWLVWSVM